MPLTLPTWAARLLRFQGIRYLMVAGTTALFYLGLVALGLWAGLFYLVAIVIAQVITILTAFPFYRRFVFESHGPLVPDFLRFLSVWLSGLIAGLVVTPLLVELLGWHPFVSQVIAVAVVSLGSFAGHRWFSFRHRDEPAGRLPRSGAEGVSL